MKAIIVLLFLVLVGCEKTSQEEGAEKYKNQFLKLAEFNCDGISSDHYVSALIDGMDYCQNENDTIRSVIFLGNNHTTYTPHSTDTIPGSAYNTISFGVFRDYGLETRIKHLFFISPHYPPTATMYQIASEVFVEGKRWPIKGKNNDNNTVTCCYDYSDFRKGFNIGHFARSNYGIQNNKYLTIDKVVIERFDDYFYYNVELSFEADLYMVDYHNVGDNLWAELINGKMVARFKVPI